MSKSFLSAWRQTTETCAAGATNYQLVGNTEAEASIGGERPVRDAGTFADMRIRVTANGVSAASTFTLQKSQVDEPVTVSYAAAETGDKVDASNTSTFAATDEARIEVTAGAGGTTIAYNLASIEFDANSNGISLPCCKSAGSSNLNVASTEDFFPVLGGRSNTTTEADREYRLQEAATWSDMYTSVGTCARTTDVIGRSRVDNANGNQTVTMSGSVDNTNYEDAANSDTVAAGADIDWSVTTGTGTGNWNLEHITSTLVHSSGNSFTGLHGLRERINGSLTRYWPIGGSMVSGEEPTEANVQQPAPFGFTLSDLTVFVQASTSGAPTYTTRKNTADGNQSVTFSAGEVAIKTDASNTDSIAANDNSAYKVTSSSGTNFDTQYIGTILAPTGGPQTVTVTSGIASAEAFGSATVGSLRTLSPTGIAAGDLYGAATITQGGVTLTGVGAIASGESFVSDDTSGLMAWDAEPGAVGYRIKVGNSTGVYDVGNSDVGNVLQYDLNDLQADLTLTTGNTYFAVVVSWDGITEGSPSNEKRFVLGAAVVFVSLNATGIASAEAFGTGAVNHVLNGTGVISEELFGTPALSVGGGAISGAGAIASAEAVPNPVVAFGNINLAGIPSAQAFGLAAITGGEPRPIGRQLWRSRKLGFLGTLGTRIH